MTDMDIEGIRTLREHKVPKEPNLRLMPADGMKLLDSSPSPSENSRLREDAEREARIVREREISAGIARAHIPLRFRDAAVEDRPEWTAALRKVAGLLRGQGAIVGIVGNRGTGKTQLAAEVIKGAVRGGATALYTTAIEFFLDIRESFRPGATETERAVLKRYAAPALLVIDEINERAESVWEDRMLVHLIDRRYRDCRDTLVLGNLTPKALRDSLGPSITDRLHDGGAVVTCEWKSYRGREVSR